MPSIAAIVTDQSGVSMTAARMPISAVEIPSPNSASSSGSPAAISVPSETSRMSAATVRPSASEEIGPCWAVWMTSPSSSIRTPSRAAARRMSSRVLPVDFGTFGARSVSGRRRMATEPFGERVAVAKGGASPMPGSAAARRTNRATAASAPALRTHTTSTVSGDCAGKRAFSRSAAARDCEPGVE
jgi:hypothetical protein